MRRRQAFGFPMPCGNTILLAARMRPLGIASYEDKIVQLAVKKILEAIYEPRFLNCMYGFRPNRGCHDAIKEVYRQLQNEWIILVNAFNCRFQLWIADAFTRYTVQTAINFVCGYNYVVDADIRVITS